MDHSPVQTTTSVEEEDEWDTDGFVIPSLEMEDQNKNDFPKVEDSKLSNFQAGKEENIYLGPHGAPPYQAKQQEQNSSSRKKFKQKLKEADSRDSGTGRENKMNSLRELVGSGQFSVTASKTLHRDWLDPHCHESQFERRNVR
ncbi:hypothetical protein OROGR_007210 [Orobanche gracilis]